MKIKEIYLTDIHFGYKHSSNLWVKNQFNFFYKQFIPDLEEINKAETPDKINIYILGDLFDNRKTIDINIGLLVKKLFNDILSNITNSYIYILGGNHDYYDNNKVNEEINIYNLLFDKKNESRLNIAYKEPLYINNTILLPWFTTLTKELLIENINKIILEVPFKYKNILCHTILPGCGESYIDAQILELLVKNNINLISGHIHTPCIQGKINCYNLGSIYPLTFMDANETRGYYINEDECIFKPLFVKNNISKRFWRFYDKRFLVVNENILKNDYIELYLPSKLFDEVGFVEELKNICAENSNITVYNIPEEINISENNNTNTKFDMVELLDKMIPEHLIDKYKLIKSDK